MHRLKREHWSTTTPIRTIFRDAFTNTGMPYFNPNSFRNTFVRLGETVCQPPEDFKAGSQNLGHEAVLTTFFSYGEVSTLRQREILEHLRLLQYSTQPDVAKFEKFGARELRNLKKYV